MDKYDAVNDHYCYLNTPILENKLHITNLNDLEIAEREITSKTIETIHYSSPPYNLEYLKSLHQSLFKDLYTWAGKLRNVNISKGDTQFCFYTYLESNTKDLFDQLEKDNWLNDLEESDFCNKLAEYYCEFNMLHPFREGNGRVQRLFFEHLALSNRYRLDWKDIESGEWINANIDGVSVDYRPMQYIFKQIITKL